VKADSRVSGAYHFVTKIDEKIGPFGTRVFLQLNGPFQYPKWMQNPREASPLTTAWAVQWAACLGGDVVPVGDGVSFPSEPSPFGMAGLPLRTLRNVVERRAAETDEQLRERIKGMSVLETYGDY
jgi:hypothetical protein